MIVEQLMLMLVMFIDGEVNVFGLKSLLNCVLLFVVLVEGIIIFINLLDSDDICYMLKVFSQFGVCYELSECKIECIVQGLGGVFNYVEYLELFLGNVGIVMCLLCVVLVVFSVNVMLIGEFCMEECLIGDLVDVLFEVGVDIKYFKNEGYLLLYIEGKML